MEFSGGFISYKGRVRNSEDLLALVVFEVGRIVLIFLEGWRHAVGEARVEKDPQRWLYCGSIGGGSRRGKQGGQRRRRVVEMC